ncbi:hypothetical protein MNBD_GAMMA09-1956 [hydrothermal vent metagenome]|uniref:Lipoprotein n=1 Tax=hydrothermal vent metagenome TaxID=652676 RepID=A0A3B0XN91_9ZZZZ
MIKNKVKTGKYLAGKIYILSICVILFSCKNYAHSEYVPIATPDALQQWCKSKTQHYFKDKNKKIENWSAFWKQNGNTLDVKATLQSENINYIVQCRVQQGESSEKAIISILDDKNQ